MNETADLPEQRPMPETLRDRMWEQLEPQLETPALRNRTMRAPLAVAASVIVLAVGAVVFQQIRGPGDDIGAGSLPPIPYSDPADVQMAKDCLQANASVSDPDRWRPAAKIDTDTAHGLLVIRDDKAAAVCNIDNGKANGAVGGVSSTDRYGKLTSERPFDYLTAMNYSTETILFGIVASDVTSVSLVGPDNSVTPAIVRDGTFIAKTKFAENSSQPTTNQVRATLGNGHVVEGPLRGR